MAVSTQRVQEVFLAAAQLADRAARAGLLDRACGSDRELRRQVEELLRASEDSPSFVLNTPGAEESATGAYTPHGAAAPRPPVDGPGTHIGPYKLLQQIGEGGMGVVYMAEQEKPVRRKVALKIVKPGMDSVQVVARFEQERQALALMDHPNIARVLDGGTTTNGRPYFVMELVHGIPITKYCDENRLTPRERLELFIPVCRAVQHAHQKGIIHRDLKPSNLLVTLYDGKPAAKVIDFGVAKATEQRLTERTLFTHYGMIIGTFEYMAPEQAENSALGVDTRSDIYSLGVVLYELLTGSTPLDRKRIKQSAYGEIVRMIREDEAPRPSTRLTASKEWLRGLADRRRTDPGRLTQEFRGELDWIVMKCLEKDRTRRYETANGLARDLERYLAGDAVEACPPSTAYRVRKFAARHRTLLATLAGFAALLVIGTFVSLGLAVRATRAEQKALDARDAEIQERKAAEEARKQGDENAAIAHTVNTFLQDDLLGQADLSNQEGGAGGRDPNVKVRTLVDRAAKRVDGRFPDQPLTEAAIRDTLGNTYMALLQNAEAQRHLERAVELRRARLGDDHPDTLMSRFHLAVSVRAQGRYDQAEAQEAEILKRRASILGAEHVDTMASRAELAVTYYYQGRLDKALALQSEVYEKRKAHLSPDDPELLAHENCLARIYLSRHDYAQASELFRRVADRRVAQLGRDHPETFTSQHDLALTYHYDGRFDVALPLLLETYEGLNSVYGAEHPRTLHARVFLANLYRDQRQYDKAEPIYRDVIRIQATIPGLIPSDILFTRRNLALMLLAQGRFDEAEATLQELLRGPAALVPGNHNEVIFHRQALARLYQVQGKYDLAETLLSEVLREHAAELGPDNTRTLYDRQAQAKLDLARGRLDRAEPVLREILEKRQERFGPDNIDTLASRGDLATLRAARGDGVGAVRLWREVVEGQRRRGGKDHPLTGLALYYLGRAQLRQERPGEAQVSLRDALSILEKARPEEWTTWHARSLLGQSLLAQGRSADAAPLLRSGYEGMNQRRVQLAAEDRHFLNEAAAQLPDRHATTGPKP